jgi:photosystem II stability/assembly factor-like uncharacterized protein
MFKAETTLGIYRKLPGVGYTIDGDTRWFVRKINDNTDSSGGRYLEIEAYDAMTLLNRRYIAYNLGNEYTTKVDFADDMAKVIMNENFGALALEPERNISAYLAIDPEYSLVSAIYKEFQRETLLASLQSLADASKENGTPLYFDILYVPETKTFIFKTYAYQRGVDLTTDNAGMKSVILGEKYNNLSDITADYNYADEANYIYVGGSGVGEIAAIASVFNAQRIAVSPYGRIESYKSGVSTASADELYDEARAELIDKTPKVTIEGKVRDIEGTKYGIHYYLGDRVTVVHNDNYFDVDVEAVTTTVTEDGETVDIVLSSITEIISATGNIVPPSPPPLPPNPPYVPPSPTPPTPPPVSSWTERYPPGGAPANKNWIAAASDSDGSNLIAAVYGGRIYISNNAGVAWSEVTPAGSIDKNWACVDSDSTGLHLIAGEFGKRLWISHDSGASWAETQPHGAADYCWFTVSMNSDGSRLFAGVYGWILFTSTNGGTTWSWSQSNPLPIASRPWHGVASNDTGTNLIACVSGGRLYTSSDSGATWVERWTDDFNWYDVDSDYDGSNLICCINNGRIYTSRDYGALWTERPPEGHADKPWICVASDSVGTVLLAGLYNGRLYKSTDAGDNWSVEQPAGNVELFWKAIDIDSDGSNLIAGVYGGRLYTYAPP